MTNNTIIKAGRAMSSIAVSHNLAPKVVLNDLATRMFPSSFSSRNGSPSSKSRSMDVAKNIFNSSRDTIDPCDYGYRVVSPTEQPRIYTSISFADNSKDHSATSSTLGTIIYSVDECAAEEVLAAQREWDEVIEAEPTRPHFEFWKEDPYAFEASSSKDLFSFIDSHDTDDYEEAEAA